MKPVAPVIRTFIRLRSQSRVMPRNGSAFAAIMRYISGARAAGTRWVIRGSSRSCPRAIRSSVASIRGRVPAGDEVRRQLALLQQRHVRPSRPRREAAVDDLSLGARQEGRVLTLRLLGLHGVQDRRDVLARRRAADRLDHLPIMAVHDRVRAVGGGQRPAAAARWPTRITRAPRARAACAAHCPIRPSPYTTTGSPGSMRARLAAL